MLYRCRLLLFRRDRFCRLEGDISKASNYRLLKYLVTYSGERTNPHMGDLRKKNIYSKDHDLMSVTGLLFLDEDTLGLRLPILALSQNNITSLQNVSGSSAVETVIKTLGITDALTLEKIIMLAASDKLEVRRPGPAF